MAVAGGGVAVGTVEAPAAAPAKNKVTYINKHQRRRNGCCVKETILKLISSSYFSFKLLFVGCK